MSRFGAQGSRIATSKLAMAVFALVGVFLVVIFTGIGAAAWHGVSHQIFLPAMPDVVGTQDSAAVTVLVHDGFSLTNIVDEWCRKALRGAPSRGRCPSPAARRPGASWCTST